MDIKKTPISKINRDKMKLIYDILNARMKRGLMPSSEKKIWGIERSGVERRLRL